jgi:hypothetical protein
MAIRKKYAYHKPSAQGVDQIVRVREAASAFEDELTKACPPSRELSVALTHLETTVMWATKSIAVNDPESEIAD